GTLEISGDYAYPAVGISNSGVVAKTGGTGTASLGSFADHGGHWRVDSGVLNLTGGGTGNGAMVVDAGPGALVFKDGTFAMDGLTANAGSAISFAGGATTFDGSVALKPGSAASFSGGTATFKGAFSAENMTVSGNATVGFTPVFWSANTNQATLSGGTITGILG